MKGVIVNYRRGRRTMNPRQMIIFFPEERNPGGKEIYGKIVALHGRKGELRVNFPKGLPGQAVGTTVTLVESKKELSKSSKKPSKSRGQR